jgi:hypothetical protein
MPDDVLKPLPVNLLRIIACDCYFFIESGQPVFVVDLAVI